MANMNNNQPTGGLPYDYYADEEEEEDMPATERELAADAEWKIIQKNTFTRWANEHLKAVNKQILDLETDLSDGLRLLGLIEVLSGHKFHKYNRRPNFRTQKLENVTMVLRYLEDDQGIRIVNIDSTDIVDHKLKLILGLIWTLILHYSITLVPPDESYFDPAGGKKKERTPKQNLLAWVQSKIPDRPIKNFTSDWNDGTAIGALVDALAPGLCPDYDRWNPKNALQNATEAMDAAEQWLNIPQVLRPEEITNPKVDELSVMTYLAQFPHAKLKPGAPLRPRTNAARVRAYGPGIEPTGNCVGAPARFTVETFSAGRGELEVTVLNPKGQKEKCDITFNKDRALSYTCVYTPTMDGVYRVLIKFANQEIPKSPFNVKVEGAVGDPSKVTAKGPGIEKSGVMVNKPTFFEVFTQGAGSGAVDVGILDPHGRKDAIRPTITKRSEDVWLVEYTPVEEGLHSVNIFFAGKPIPKSPYGVGVSPISEAGKAFATGRGIQPKGVRVNDQADFKVHTQEAGQGELKVQVIGPAGKEERIRVKKLDAHTYECGYTPTKPGIYTVHVLWGGQPISKAPFRVDVGPQKDSKIIAFGPGLEAGVVGFPACFTVETHGETGAVGFLIDGPSEVKIESKDNGDNSADITYWPTEPGEHAIHVLCNNEDIPKSPFMADIVPNTGLFDPSLVTASGPGLEKTGVTVNKWAEFVVDTRQAGRAALDIKCIDADHNNVDVIIQDNRDGTYWCRYMPKKKKVPTATLR